MRSAAALHKLILWLVLGILALLWLGAATILLAPYRSETGAMAPQPASWMLPRTSPSTTSPPSSCRARERLRDMRLRRCGAHVDSNRFSALSEEAAQRA